MINFNIFSFRPFHGFLKFSCGSTDKETVQGCFDDLEKFNDYQADIPNSIKKLSIFDLLDLLTTNEKTIKTNLNSVIEDSVCISWKTATREQKKTLLKKTVYEFLLSRINTLKKKEINQQEINLIVNKDLFSSDFYTYNKNNKNEDMQNILNELKNTDFFSCFFNKLFESIKNEKIKTKKLPFNLNIIFFFFGICFLAIICFGAIHKFLFDISLLIIILKLLVNVLVCLSFCLPDYMEQAINYILGELHITRIDKNTFDLLMIGGFYLVCLINLDLNFILYLILQPSVLGFFLAYINISVHLDILQKNIHIARFMIISMLALSILGLISPFGNFNNLINIIGVINLCCLFFVEKIAKIYEEKSLENLLEKRNQNAAEIYNIEAVINIEEEVQNRFNAKKTETTTNKAREFDEESEPQQNTKSILEWPVVKIVILLLLGLAPSLIIKESIAPMAAQGILALCFVSDAWGIEKPEFNIYRFVLNLLGLGYFLLYLYDYGVLQQPLAIVLSYMKSILLYDSMVVWGPLLIVFGLVGSIFLIFKVDNFNINQDTSIRLNLLKKTLLLFGFFYFNFNLFQNICLFKIIIILNSILFLLLETCENIFISKKVISDKVLNNIKMVVLLNSAISTVSAAIFLYYYYNTMNKIMSFGVVLLSLSNLISAIAQTTMVHIKIHGIINTMEFSKKFHWNSFVKINSLVILLLFVFAINNISFTNPTNLLCNLLKIKAGYFFIFLLTYYICPYFGKDSSKHKTLVFLCLLLFAGLIFFNISFQSELLNEIIKISIVLVSGIFVKLMTYNEYQDTQEDKQAGQNHKVKYLHSFGIISFLILNFLYILSCHGDKFKHQDQFIPRDSLKSLPKLLPLPLKIVVNICQFVFNKILTGPFFSFHIPFLFSVVILASLFGLFSVSSFYTNVIKTPSIKIYNFGKTSIKWFLGPVIKTFHNHPRKDFVNKTMKSVFTRSNVNMSIITGVITFICIMLPAGILIA